MFLADGFHEESDYEEGDDEQIVVCHLHMVCLHLECREYRRDDETPEEFATIGEHDARNHRRQIGKSHHFPKVAGGDDDKEITAESPYHGSQCCHPLAEIERAQKDIESQQVGEDEPHVLGQPQVVGINRLVQSVGTVV